MTQTLEQAITAQGRNLWLDPDDVTEIARDVHESDWLGGLLEQARVEGAREALGARQFDIVGACSKCDRPMVSRLDWVKMSRIERINRGQHEAGGHCRACYEGMRRQGIKVPTSRYKVADLIEDVVDLRAQGVDSRRQLADRLGLKLKTLETALLRAKKNGDERAATILEEVRR